MKKTFIVLFLILFVPIQAPAKRVHIEYPDSITVEDIEYRASYEDGIFFHTAFVEATNIKTQKTVWKKKIYSTLMNPFFEHDVQWVMITKIESQNNSLLIVNEDNKQFLLDLNTLNIE